MTLSSTGFPWLKARGAARRDCVAPPASGAHEETHPRALAELAHGNGRIARRLESLRALTEREILGCGRVLSTIVENVRDLIAENERSVSESTSRSREVTARFVAEIQGDVNAQEAAVKRLLEVADGMAGAIEAISGLSHYSNILSINARIEAARIGAAGGGFAVIADHTRDLSKTIQEAAARVSTAIDAVRQGLPSVTQRAVVIQDRTRAFIEIVDDQVQSASLQAATGATGTRGLSAVINLSNQALSHLQFHDPLVQQLAAIDRDLEVVSDRVSRTLGGEVLPEAPAEADASAQARPAPGAITLF
jgi:methyl-accepting chemotaxis protein